MDMRQCWAHGVGSGHCWADMYYLSLVFFIPSHSTTLNGGGGEKTRGGQTKEELLLGKTNKNRLWFLGRKKTLGGGRKGRTGLGQGDIFERRKEGDRITLPVHSSAFSSLCIYHTCGFKTYKHCSKGSWRKHMSHFPVSPSLPTHPQTDRTWTRHFACHVCMCIVCGTLLVDSG